MVNPSLMSVTSSFNRKALKPSLYKLLICLKAFLFLFSTRSFDIISTELRFVILLSLFSHLPLAIQNKPAPLLFFSLSSLSPSLPCHSPSHFPPVLTLSDLGLGFLGFFLYWAPAMTKHQHKWLFWVCLWLMGPQGFPMFGIILTLSKILPIYLLQNLFYITDFYHYKHYMAVFPWQVNNFINMCIRDIIYQP